MKNKVYIGIDIGAKGGIAAIKNSKIVYKSVMPMVAGTTQIDVLKLGSILKKLKNKYDTTHVIFEKFSGFFSYGKKQATSVARQAGSLETLIVLMRLPYSAVSPKVWQGEMFKNTTLMTKNKKEKVNGSSVNKSVKDTKKMALITINRLLPDVNWLASKRSTVPHDGMIDAGLMALYAERKGF